MSCVKITTVVVVNDLTPLQVTGLLRPQNEHEANYCIPVFTYCIHQWVITPVFASLSYYNWGVCLVKSLVVYFLFVAAKRTSHFLSLQGFWLFNFNIFPDFKGKAVETRNPRVTTPSEMASRRYLEQGRALTAQGCPPPWASREIRVRRVKREKTGPVWVREICESKIANSRGYSGSTTEGLKWVDKAIFKLSW